MPVSALNSFLPMVYSLSKLSAEDKQEMGALKQNGDKSENLNLCIHKKSAKVYSMLIHVTLKKIYALALIIKLANKIM